MEENDLTLETMDGVLNIRVAAIIEANGLYLVNKWENHESLIGGRVKFNESTEYAIIREIYEETGMNVHRMKYRALVENFYEEDGRPVHEFLNIYEVETAEEINENAVDFNHQQLKWVSVDELSKLKPDVLAKIILSEQEGILHYTNYDEQN
jgi:8-oxo-dGTP pyrophosphatase MutT (NUDIX family)